MATLSSILAWRILWTEEPGGLQFMGWQRDTTERMSTRVNRKPKITGSRPVGAYLSCVAESSEVISSVVKGLKKPGFCCCAHLSFIIGRRQLQLCPQTSFPGSQKGKNTGHISVCAPKEEPPRLSSFSTLNTLDLVRNLTQRLLPSIIGKICVDEEARLLCCHDKIKDLTDSKENSEGWILINQIADCHVAKY